MGFVVQLTGLWPRGSAMGLQGTAKALAAVRCTWVEPDTQGLHYAQYYALEEELHFESFQRKKKKKKKKT